MKGGSYGEDGKEQRMRMRKLNKDSDVSGNQFTCPVPNIRLGFKLLRLIGACRFHRLTCSQDYQPFCTLTCRPQFYCKEMPSALEVRVLRHTRGLSHSIQEGSFDGPIRTECKKRTMDCIGSATAVCEARTIEARRP